MNFSQDKQQEQAARWLARSQDKDFTSDDLKALNAWLEEDPANRAAFEEMGAVWDQVEGMEHVFNSEEKHTCSDLPVTSQPTGRLRGAKRILPRILTGNRKVALVGAVMAVLVLLCLPVIKSHLVDQPEKLYAYQTVAGEQKIVTLSDGSVLKMNVSSQISVHITGHNRQVEMGEGEVFFQVKPDPDRPFEVSTPSGLVQVLGTAFNVKNRRGKVSVDVDHGRVQVQGNPASPTDMKTKEMTLSSGQGVDINPSGRLVKLRQSNIKQVLAWRQKQAVFKNTPVGDVLHELELYHNVKITLVSDELESKGITGTFDMSKLEQTLELIAMAASLKIEKESDSTIKLYR